MSAQSPAPGGSGQTDFPAGPVTQVGNQDGGWPEPNTGAGWPATVDVPPRRRPRGHTLLWFGGASAVLLVVGLVSVLLLVLNGRIGGHGVLARDQAAAQDARPPLARRCPPPTVEPAPPPAAPLPAATGPRTVDQAAGISYRAYGTPWEPWPYLWRAGTLGVPYAVGQDILTEDYEGGYYASILSAAVPATVNDSLALDLGCVGRQVATDVRTEYYPQPNRMDLLREGRTTLGGRPAWVTKFRLHFNEPGLNAKDELVAVALIDVGRPAAAILYVSIPGTHRQWDWVVDDVLASVRQI